MKAAARKRATRAPRPRVAASRAPSKFLRIKVTSAPFRHCFKQQPGCILPRGWRCRHPSSGEVDGRPLEFPHGRIPPRARASEARAARSAASLTKGGGERLAPPRRRSFSPPLPNGSRRPRRAPIRSLRRKIMSLRALLIGAAALALLATHPASATPRPGAVHPRHFCAGSIGVPLDLNLASGATSLAPGLTDDVTGTVTAHANLSSVRVQLVTEGDVQLLSASTIDLGPAGKEGTLTFHATVRYGPSGRGALLAHVVAQDLAQVSLERNEGLYAVPSHGAVVTDMGDYLLAAHKAVSMDKLKGLVDPASLLQEEKALNTLEVTHSVPSGAIVPGVSVPAAAFATLSPAISPEDAATGARRATSSSGRLNVNAATATVTVHGTVLWTDENGNTHPAYGMTVQVRDDELIGSDLVTD